MQRFLIAGIAAFIAVLLLLGLAVGDAFGHSFYPAECCSDRDCAPYPRVLVKESPEGYTLATGEFIERKRARFSPDGDFHLCRLESTQAILCFFVPNNGS